MSDLAPTPRRLNPALLQALVRAALPLVGVIFLGWSAVEVLAYYFLETILIGLFNVPKLALASGEGAAPALVMVPFFVVHYGAFVGIQAVFVFIVPDVLDEALALFRGPEGMVALALAIGWEAADLVSWLRGKRPNRNMQMFLPYPRILVQQFVAIFGGWGLMLLQGRAAATWSLVVLVVVRFVVDAWVGPFFVSTLQEKAEEEGGIELRFKGLHDD